MSYNNLYVIGDYRTSSQPKNANRNTISVFDEETGGLIDVLKIGNSNDHLHQIWVNRKTNEIYATGSCYTKSDRPDLPFLHDVVFHFDLSTRKLKRLKIYHDYDDGKEGGLGSLIFNTQNDIIYVASVYAQGGNKVLYLIDKENFEVKKSISMRRYGPLGMLMDEKRNLIHILNTDEVSNIKTIDCNINEIIQTIDLPEDIHSVSPYANIQKMALNTEKNILSLILNGDFYQLNLQDKSIKKLNFNEHFERIIINNKTNRLYTVTSKNSDNFEQSGKLYSLNIIEKDQIKPQFNSNIKIDYLFINPDKNVLCIRTNDDTKYPLTVNKLHFLKEYQ